MTNTLTQLLILFISLFVLFSMVSISLSQITLALAFVVVAIRVAKKLGLRYEKDVILDGYTHPDHVYVIERD